MYSPRIIQQNIERVEASTRITLKRNDIAESIGRSAEINALKDGDKFLRQLNRSEQEYVRNETILCHLDFTYWAERYAIINQDPEITGVGGMKPLQIWEPQIIALSKIASREEKDFYEANCGRTADGIRIAWHKARQLGATTLARCIAMHRKTLHEGYRGLAASIDDDTVGLLYKKDKLIYDNLPWFLKPAIEFDVKNAELTFAAIKSGITYQQSRQRSGMGIGAQHNGVSHLTECSSWDYPENDIELSFFPSLPRARATFCVLESTARGRGNWWHNFTEGVRKGHRVDWIYMFVPWYAASQKYRRSPPIDWVPSEETILHAKKVEETSYEFMGYTVRLPLPQLYWYETERKAYRKEGRLNHFLSNWCATPNESFQHTNVSAFSPEFLEQARLGTSVGIPYEVEKRT